MMKVGHIKMQKRAEMNGDNDYKSLPIYMYIVGRPITKGTLIA